MAMGGEQDLQAGSVGDTGAAIRIEREGDGVVVRVIYPEERRGRDVRTVWLVCAGIGLLSALVVALFWRGVVGRFAFVAAVIASVYVTMVLVRQFLAVTRSYELRAGPAELTVESPS